MLELIDEFEMEVEESAEKAEDEQQVLGPRGERLRARLGFFEPDEVAAELSAATASAVEFIDVPDDLAQQAMIRDGMPGFAAEQIVKAFGRRRQGVAAQVTPAIETLTGSAPRDFASFARSHARQFAPATVTAKR